MEKNRSWPVDSLTYATYLSAAGSRCPAHKRGDPSPSKEFSAVTVMSLPCTQFCHVRSPVSLDTQFYSTWTPGGPPKDPPQMVGRKGRDGVIELRGGVQGVHFIAAVKSTHQWKGCLQMTPTRTLAHTCSGNNVRNSERRYRVQFK